MIAAARAERHDHLRKGKICDQTLNRNLLCRCFLPAGGGRRQRRAAKVTRKVGEGHQQQYTVQLVTTVYILSR